MCPWRRISLIRGNHDALAEHLEWDAPIVDVQRVFVPDPGMPKIVALWASHYGYRVWPDAWRGDLHLYGHSHGSLPGTRTSLDVGVDCWDWAPVRLAVTQERMSETPGTEAGVWPHSRDPGRSPPTRGLEGQAWRSASVAWGAGNAGT